MHIRENIIGIGGTNGSGKDTLGEILAKKYGFKFISLTDMLRVECRERGLPIERENLRMISAEWREKNGLGAPIDKVLEVYKLQSGNYKGLVTASLRNPGEADRIHEFGGIVIWMDADPKTRYERVIGSNRGRDTEDNKTFEQFLQEEYDEMYPKPEADATALATIEVRNRADATIMNESTREVLETEISELLQTYN
jgi:dephospho-CoA kinase